MSLAYDIILSTASGVVKSLGKDRGRKDYVTKFDLFAKGQRGVMSALRQDLKGQKGDRRKTLWIHSASLGEYAIARPVIEEIRSRGDWRVVMTFFSPSGYEALKNNHPGIDYLYYLPLDTKKNVKEFLDMVKPTMAAFTVSEYWYNYLSELRRRSIPTFLISSKITPKSIFNRWYGFLHRNCLKTYTRFFVLDEASRDNLDRLGYSNVTISGNPLFDNAISKARTQWTNPKLARFAEGHDKVFIAGSIHDEKDLALVTELANRHRDTRFIMVPHAIEEKMMAAIEAGVDRSCVRLSKATDDELTHSDIVIVDSLGELSYLYRYGHYAYVGGGFTPYLHSLIEATVYGLPVAFGPCTQRKVTPEQLERLGIGCKISDIDELDRWFTSIKGNKAELERVKKCAADYVASNAKATTEIVNLMLR